MLMAENWKSYFFESAGKATYQWPIRIFSAIRHKIGYNLAENWKYEPIKKSTHTADSKNCC